MSRPPVRLSLATAVVLAVAAPPVVAAATGATGTSRVAAKGCAPARHAGGEWRTYGHDYANTRSQPAEHTITPLRAATLTKAFTFSAHDGGGDGDFTGTPIVADGCLFVASNTGWVFAANADTGRPVWASHLDADGAEITSTPTVAEGQVFVAVGRTGSPYVAALDERTGKVRWRTVTDRQDGADAYGSPVVFDGVLFEGISGGSAELGDSSARDAFEGGFVLIETRGRHAGRVLHKTYTVRPPGKNVQQGGATVWATPAIDAKDKLAFVGTGNPFHPQSQPKHADAIIKVDLNRRSKTFGRIVGYYDGTPDVYASGASKAPCVDFPGNPAPYYPQGLGSCGDIDLDFGSSPNLIHGPNGRVLIGEGQKSGVYHLVDAKTMKKVWQQVIGLPSDLGGVVGSTAYDGHAVYGPITLGGYLWSLGAGNGGLRWAAPIADGAHWGNPVSEADGVVYTVGLTGFLDAYDAATGVPVLHHWMGGDLGGGDLAASWGGVSVARNTVYAAIGMTGLPDGNVVAYRPGAAVPAGAPSASPPRAGGSSPAHVVTGPQAQSYGYATPVVVVKRGGTVTYSNFDLVRHNVVQDVAADHKWGSKKMRWCKQFRRNRCPLFWSRLIGLGETTTVQGVNHLKPGTYTFYCTLHPGMAGRLIVRP